MKKLKFNSSVVLMGLLISCTVHGGGPSRGSSSSSKNTVNSIDVAGTSYAAGSTSIVDEPFNIEDGQYVNEAFEYIKFVQQWPPTVCLAHKRDNKANVCAFPKHDRWTVHGMWPIKSREESPKKCYTKSLTKSQSNGLFNEKCLTGLREEMEERWTAIKDFSYPMGFWKHEWLEHGTCAAAIDSMNGVYRYFKTGLEWSRKYDIAGMLANGGVKPGNAYSVRQITEAIMKGVENKFPQLYCFHDKGAQYLLEIRLCLNKEDLKPRECGKVLSTQRCDPAKKIQYYTKDQILGEFETFHILKFTQLWAPSAYMSFKQDNPNHKGELIGGWTVGSLRPATYTGKDLIDANPNPYVPEAGDAGQEGLMVEKWMNLKDKSRPRNLWRKEWEQSQKYLDNSKQVNNYSQYLGLVAEKVWKYNLTTLGEENVEPGNEYSLKEITEKVKTLSEQKRPIISCVRNKVNKASYLHKIQVCMNRKLETIDCLPTEEGNCDSERILFPTVESVKNILKSRETRPSVVESAPVVSQGNEKPTQNGEIPHGSETGEGSNEKGTIPKTKSSDLESGRREGTITTGGHSSREGQRSGSAGRKSSKSPTGKGSQLSHQGTTSNDRRSPNRVGTSITGGNPPGKRQGSKSPTGRGSEVTQPKTTSDDRNSPNRVGISTTGENPLGQKQRSGSASRKLSKKPTRKDSKVTQPKTTSNDQESIKREGTITTEGHSSRQGQRSGSASRKLLKSPTGEGSPLSQQPRTTSKDRNSPNRVGTSTTGENPPGQKQKTGSKGRKSKKVPKAQNPQQKPKKTQGRGSSRQG